MICIDLKDFSPLATQKDDSLNSYIFGVIILIILISFHNIILLNYRKF